MSSVPDVGVTHRALRYLWRHNSVAPQRNNWTAFKQYTSFCGKLGCCWQKNQMGISNLICNLPFIIEGGGPSYCKFLTPVIIPVSLFTSLSIVGWLWGFLTNSHKAPLKFTDICFYGVEWVSGVCIEGLLVIYRICTECTTDGTEGILCRNWPVFLDCFACVCKCFSQSCSTFPDQVCFSSLQTRELFMEHLNHGSGDTVYIILQLWRDHSSLCQRAWFKPRLSSSRIDLLYRFFLNLSPGPVKHLVKEIFRFGATWTESQPVPPNCCSHCISNIGPVLLFQQIAYVLSLWAVGPWD